MHLGRFPDSMEFQSWKVNFKTEVCAKTANHRITMHWITVVEKAQSIDEIDDIPIDSREKRFPQLRDAGCTESVFIEKASQLAWSLPEKEYVSRSSGAPKHDRFLRGRQIAYMIYKHFRATGAHEAVQGLSDLFKKHLRVYSTSLIFLVMESS